MSEAKRGGPARGPAGQAESYAATTYAARGGISYGIGGSGAPRRPAVTGAPEHTLAAPSGTERHRIARSMVPLVVPSQVPPFSAGVR
jgi:hypothetical protein